MRKIDTNVKAGEGFKIYDLVNFCDCEIGDNTKIRMIVEIRKGAKIRRNRNISIYIFICELVSSHNRGRGERRREGCPPETFLAGIPASFFGKVDTKQQKWVRVVY